MRAHWEFARSSPKVIGSSLGVRRKRIERLTRSSSEDVGKFVKSSKDQLTCQTRTIIIYRWWVVVVVPSVGRDSGTA
ncbi:hypothetical protein GW17_00016232 [Ensete ventricosum]|nr:hypothetical protein GW17_00016232 [Ensete ventricosum]